MYLAYSTYPLRATKASIYFKCKTFSFTQNLQTIVISYNLSPLSKFFLDFYPLQLTLLTTDHVIYKY